jgi:hypothetical protein
MSPPLDGSLHGASWILPRRHKIQDAERDLKGYGHSTVHQAYTHAELGIRRHYVIGESGGPWFLSPDLT